MTRPFGPHAYSPAPLAGCFWADEVPDAALAAPPVDGALKADYAIVGGGYTGLNAALALAETGADVVLLDAEFPGWGASGRNGGFCCLGGTRASDTAIERRHGPGAARQVRQAELAAVAHVSDLLDRFGLDADRHTDGEVILAHSARSMAALRREKATVDAGYGVTSRLIERADLAAHGMAGPHHGALVVPVGFALHPRKYLGGLARAARQAGARLFGGSPVRAVRSKGAGWQLTTPGGEVTCRRLLLATNGYSSDDVPEWMRHRFLPAQSSVLATRPLTTGELTAQGWTTHRMAYENRRLLHYFHLTADNRMVFGQRGGLVSSPASEARIARRVRADFAAMFPAWAGVEVPFEWSGMVCLTASLVPFCGAVPGMPGVYAAFGYHGNGVAMGSWCGARLARLARGEAPAIPRAFAAPPPRFPLGPLRRAWLAADYARARLTGG